MCCFNNEVFRTLVSDLINDSFYTEQISIRGKIKTVRQYSEVIIRRILNISNDDFLTIGHRKILKRIKEKSNNLLLLKALDKICKYGNEATHTQKTYPYNDDDLKNILDALFVLYSYVIL